jgi:hypothetical protein
MEDLQLVYGIHKIVNSIHTEFELD